MEPKLILREGILIIFILLICFQYGCVTDKHRYRSYQDMKDFVLDEYNRRGGYLLFFKTHVKDSIIYIDTDNLQYSLYRSSKLNKSYFKDIMMGKVILSCEDFGECFTLAPHIIDEYKKKGIEGFMKMYTTYDEGNNRYFINSSNHDEELSIAYFFYLNNIYTRIDEYTRHFISRKDLKEIPVIINEEDLEEIVK